MLLPQPPLLAHACTEKWVLVREIAIAIEFAHASASLEY
jgi:hypothetical protein